ncbi:MAG: xanthine permease, partial [Chloroflexi bacterium]|nr:xanthine permease [Chloroflexota bacterium]
SIGLGNLYYAWQARRLSLKEGRDDVTAVPYGVSVPHYFICSFLVMGPVYLKTGDWYLAWSIGVAWNFVHAIIEIAGAFVGGFIRRVTPRAAMLGTLAGVALTFIAMRPAMEVWEVPYIGLVCLAIILIGWFARKSFPGNIPAGLLAILAGTVIGWASGYMKAESLAQAVAGFSVAVPVPGLAAIINGMRYIGPYLAMAIPLAIYDFLESMNNVESAEAAGDRYNTVETMLVAGIGTLVGALFGSPFPTLVYIGHPGWKSVGARVGYSWATGVGILVVGLFGILPLLLALIPLVAILPI